MGKVLSNRKVSEDFFLMKVKHNNNAVMGQFYMLRSWEQFPVLSRPISIYERDEETVTFLYKKIGTGTELLSKLKPDDEITLDGPYGNGFPKVEGKIALVGGGVGIAPLYYTAKVLKELNKQNEVTTYLGFSGEPVLVEEFEKAGDKVIINVGGFITDEINPDNFDYILACGPTPMMKVLYEKCKYTKAVVYVSMENRMACGVGACLVCTCKTTKGNKKVCKDGPVFLAEEVFNHE